MLSNMTALVINSLTANGKECKLEGSIEFFTELYLGQPHERDANDFAYERVKALLGASQELQELLAFWTPKKPISDRCMRNCTDR